jgi:polyisoprenoid-binding protein YceI
MSATTGARMTVKDDVAPYVLDASASRFTIRAFASGLFSGFGHNPTIDVKDFKGEARFAPGTLENASLNFSINADSLAVGDDASPKDREEIETRMKQDVLETSRFPEISYQSNEVISKAIGDTRFSVVLKGDLTLHGVTRPQDIPAQVLLMNGTLRASGDFSLLQTDFDIRLVSVAGGTLKVKDELKLSFNIVARQA